MRGCWDHATAAPGDHDGAERIGVVGGIGQHQVGTVVRKQGCGLRCIAPVPGGEPDAHRTAQATHGQVDLGAQAAGAAF